MRKFLIGALLTAASLTCLAGVDVNKAGAADLDSIKGIGPSTSTKIIEARKATPFKDWDDLIKRVPGVGPKRAEHLSAQGLTVNGAPYKTGHATVAAKPVDRKTTDTRSTVTPAPAR